MLDVGPFEAIFEGSKCIQLGDGFESLLLALKAPDLDADGRCPSIKPMIDGSQVAGQVGRCGLEVGCRIWVSVVASA